MDTKLTLKLDRAVIEKAKKYAKENNTSLSRMVGNYLRSVIETYEEPENVTPFVKSLSGIIPTPAGDHKQSYTDFLSEKYK